MQDLWVWSLSRELRSHRPHKVAKKKKKKDFFKNYVGIKKKVWEISVHGVSISLQLVITTSVYLVCIFIFIYLQT